MQQTSPQPRGRQSAVFEHVPSSPVQQILLQYFDSSALDIIEMIGIGKGAITVKARMANYGLVAAKCIPNGESAFEEFSPPSTGRDVHNSSWSFPKEILLHSLLKHERIPALIGICTKPNEVLLIQELVTNSFSPEHPSDLWSLLYLSERRLSLAEVLRIGQHILEALEYLHVEQNICHCDVQPKNILIDDAKCAFLIDFGCARRCPNDSKGGRGRGESTTTSSSRLEGCTNYLAPEVIKDNGTHSPLSDIYSFGLVLLEMLTEEQPWLGKTEGEIEFQLQVNKKNALNYKPGVREKVYAAHSDEFKSCGEEVDLLLELLERTLSFKPSDRPSARALKTQLCTLSKQINRL